MTAGVSSMTGGAHVTVVGCTFRVLDFAGSLTKHLVQAKCVHGLRDVRPLGEDGTDIPSFVGRSRRDKSHS